ncbi:tyrosine phosphatase family-domain-containing protein [Limtongia smithiae]|uniref:tyrosine phosphatase family-domain-containing protein n=1 Tax=Limtongia smithiae TaxID=1125753 RepID=UPI0034CDC8B7
MLAPPELFGIVEEGIYRCTEIDPLNFPFLQTLSLNTILLISRQKPSPAVELFATENEISIAHMQLPQWQMSEEDWKLLPDNIVQNCLAYVLNMTHYPILIIDLSCTFIGVLRKLQHWNLSSIINEYREMSFDRSQYLYQVYIEMVDLKTFSIPKVKLIRSNVAGSEESYLKSSETSKDLYYKGWKIEIEEAKDFAVCPSLIKSANDGSSFFLRLTTQSRSRIHITTLPMWFITYECMWYEDKLAFAGEKRTNKV